MPEWTANTPWWVIAGFGIALIGAVVKASMWAGSVNSRFDSVDSRLDSLSDGLAESA